MDASPEWVRVQWKLPLSPFHFTNPLAFPGGISPTIHQFLFILLVKSYIAE